MLFYVFSIVLNCAKETGERVSTSHNRTQVEEEAGDGRSACDKTIELTFLINCFKQCASMVRILEKRTITICYKDLVRYHVGIYCTMG